MKTFGLLNMICVVFVFCAATAIALPAQVLTTLHSFDGSDGGSPHAGLIQGTDGNFYGTTVGGGAYGYGTVFGITPSGRLATLYSFCSQRNCADGDLPYAGLAQDSYGDFYGTTSLGGTNDDGTLFALVGGDLFAFYSFCSQANCADGSDPEAGVILGTDGNLYGTTVGGGIYCPRLSGGCGTVFEFSSAGLTTLHSFDGSDGASPYGGLVQATDGNFYGTTANGGLEGCGPFGTGCGTVFKITPGGTLTTLHSFCSQNNCRDGANPSAGLIQATDGNFYGTASRGGFVSGWGTVFQITPTGTLTTLYAFLGHTDGAYPSAGLIQGTDGNFYGTTLEGGAYDGGTVFRITTSGTLTTLHSFDGSDGWGPYAGLIQGTDGNFYGITHGGGAYGWGTVFRLVLPRACIVCPAAE